MKANKFFAVALAALTLMACNKKDEPQKESLVLTPTSMTLKVGETGTITANIAVDSWSSNNAEVAFCVAGVVTAVAEGNAIISATANGETKTCVVLVEKAAGPSGDDKTIEAAHIWPVILDAVTSEKYASLIAGDFRPNDNDNNLWIWPGGQSYVAGEATGKNFFGNTEGYLALTVAQWAEAWSGAGFCCENAESVAAAQALKEGIVANPDKYFLHIAIKAANEGNHEFYTFGTDATAFNIGSAIIEKGGLIGDFTRDGEWHEFDVPMAQFATAIAGAEVKAGINMLCFLSGNQVGAQLNLDAVYFYEKK